MIVFYFFMLIHISFLLVSKRWRLMADVLNDLAFCIDLTCAHLPQEFFVFCVCASSAMRAIVGVAGGGTRMAIVRHQVSSILFLQFCFF